MTKKNYAFACVAALIFIVLLVITLNTPCVADIENSNCWNISESEMSTYCPFAENIGDNNTVSIIYFPWQSSYNNSRHIWKVLYL